MKPHLRISSLSATALQLVSGVTIVTHNREQSGVVIEEDASVGTGAIILPNVTIGRGAIVTARSVVTRSVPPKTMVQGNPARPIATVEVPLRLDVPVKEFAKGLKPIRPAAPADGPKENGTCVCVEQTALKRD